MKKDSQINLLSHSQAKVRLLSEYLKRYLNIISNDNHTKEIQVYDLFCGEGIYENGGEGSPLLILRQIKDMHFTNPANRRLIPPVNCHFNDLDSRKVEKVKAAVAAKSLHYPDFGSIGYSSTDYQSLLDQLVKAFTNLKSQKQKAFVFIDPYQYRHISGSQIAALMASGCVEVLLWLPTQFMYRFAKNGTPEALYDFISELIPDFSDQGFDDVWSFIKKIKEGFHSLLGESFFVDTFTIQKDPSTVFCLFFFTSHILGFQKMLEAKWDIDTEQGKGWHYQENQLSFLSQYKTNPLEADLVEFLRTKPRSNVEIYLFTINRGFLPKHTNEVLRNWQNTQRITIASPTGTKPRKKAFYIAYEYYKQNQVKVIFSLS
jgi:three-Cys-motif partner protein